MPPSLRTQRLRLTWVLALPFLLLSHPTPFHILLGALLALPGLVLRAAAAGYIVKDVSLAMHGPYAHLRHPLYLGSFLAGLGLAVAAGRWLLVAGFLLLFPLIYTRAIRAEEEELEDRFGNAWRRYRRKVPALVPATALRWARTGEIGGPILGNGQSREDLPVREGPPTFQPGCFRRNRGWEAPLGVLGGFVLLWLRMRGLS
ncbi:MAG: isoprenylcysteine carboxylmethyltransferase family protein [Longimicrobiales bacterium]